MAVILCILKDFFFKKNLFPFHAFLQLVGVVKTTAMPINNYCVDDVSFKGRCDRDLVLGCTSSGKTPQE
jgi:hypothetical protein